MTLLQQIIMVSAGVAATMLTRFIPFIAVAFTILIHVWKRNMMWSIAAGTLCYMLLIRI